MSSFQCGTSLVECLATATGRGINRDSQQGRKTKQGRGEVQLCTDSTATASARVKAWEGSRSPDKEIGDVVFFSLQSIQRPLDNNLQITCAKEK